MVETRVADSGLVVEVAEVDDMAKVVMAEAMVKD